MIDDDFNGFYVFDDETGYIVYKMNVLIMKDVNCNWLTLNWNIWFVL